MALHAQCLCGNRFTVKEEFAGKRGKCPACGHVLVLPKSNSAEAKDGDEATRTCPGCQKNLPANAVVCVSCGWDFRTGKRLRAVKNVEASDEESATEPEETAGNNLLIPMFAGGAVAALAFVGVLLFLFWGSSDTPPDLAKAKKAQPNFGTAPAPSPTVPHVPVAPSVPFAKGNEVPGKPPAGNFVPPPTPAPPPKAPPVETPTTSQPAETPAVIKSLLASVAAVSPSNVERYEKFLEEPTAMNALLYRGTLPFLEKEVRATIDAGLAKQAMAALVKVIDEKRRSTSKLEILICAQAIDALGNFREHGAEIVPLLTELQRVPENAIGATATTALRRIQGKTPPPPNQPPLTPSKLASNDSEFKILHAKFTDTFALRNPISPTQLSMVSAREGSRLFWTEIKISKRARLTIELGTLRLRDSVGNAYSLTGYHVVPEYAKKGPALISTLLQAEGLRGSMLGVTISGKVSTRFPTMEIESSPDRIMLNIFRGDAIVSLMFVVPENASIVALQDFLGREIVLGDGGK